MKILLPTDSFPPNTGGVGWSTYYLARGLVNHGHDVEVIVTKPNLTGTSVGVYKGMKTVYFGYKTSKIPLVKNYYKHEVFWKEFEGFLTKRLESKKFDVIHAQHQMTTTPAAHAGEKMSVPVVSTIRNYWPLCYFGTMLSSKLNDCGLGCKDSRLLLPFKPVIKYYMKRNVKGKQEALQKCSRIISVSHFVKNMTARVVDAEKIDVVPNIMEPIGGKRNEGDFILFVGNVSREKGIPLLLDALKRVKNAPKTLIAGDGPLMDYVRQRAEKEWLDVELLGRLPHDKVVERMLSCRLLAFPSVWHEPFSRTLIEACMLGIPIVATDTGGTSDIIENIKTGLISPAEPRAFAANLSSVLKDPSLRRRLATNAKALAKRNFTESAVIAKIEDVYRKAIAS